MTSWPPMAAPVAAASDDGWAHTRPAFTSAAWAASAAARPSVWRLALSKRLAAISDAPANAQTSGRATQDEAWPPLESIDPSGLQAMTGPKRLARPLNAAAVLRAVSMFAGLCRSPRPHSQAYHWPLSWLTRMVSLWAK